METDGFCFFVSQTVYLVDKYLNYGLFFFYFERNLFKIFAIVYFNIYLWKQIINYYLSLKFNPSVGRRSL